MDWLGKVTNFLSALPSASGVVGNVLAGFNQRASRKWEEQMYLKYNSPSALVRQYDEAGINPALMFGGQTPAAPQMDTSTPVIDFNSGNTTEMLAQLMNLSKLGAEKDKLQAEADKIREEARGEFLRNAITEEYGSKEADARYRQIEQAIEESLAKTGEASTQSALNAAMADLKRVEKDSEELRQYEVKWKKLFIEKWNMSPELAGELVRAASTIVASGIMSASQIIKIFQGNKGTHTRSITEKQADGNTTITDVFTNIGD